MGINMITTTRTITNNLVDIHSHIIYDVDDGSDSKEKSIEYLKEAKKCGIEKIVCTPHIRRGNREKIEKIIKHFLELRTYAEKLEIELYLGTEILITENTCELLKKKRLRSINGNKYILVEFRRDENMDIDNLIYKLEELSDTGYIPILAHPELYVNYRKINDMKRIRDCGVLLQLDATSINKSTTTSKIYKFSKKLLKERLIDVVASDTHCIKKRNYLSFYKAYKFVSKKYGQEYADIIFKENPNEIIKEQN